MRTRVASLFIGAVLVAACTSATPTPTATPGGPSVAPSAAPSSEASGVPTTEAPASVAPTAEATAEPTPESSAAESLAPGASPIVDSLTVKRTASCTSDNGTGTVGMIRLTWTTTAATGVRVSIDPPSPAQAYEFGYADYPTPDGFADVPFACGAPNHDANGAYHLYVVSTLHTSGYSYYRYAKVYEIVPAATP